MFKNKALWKPKNPHSLEYLKYLYGVLTKNATVTENNRSLLVEALRMISEIMIWGDQNDSTVFDFFLEKNMLAFFLKIMKQKSGRFVCTQLLQTLNILFENISHETSLYYLLSNNHVNSIITHRFDFSDEEILAYYISFLKTLSFKLNSNTIHFFFNEHTNDFPLYTEAIKFFNHTESMVRIAVRTLTLNVYKVEDSAMLNFIRDRTAAPYFSNLVWFICNHILEIEICAQAETSLQLLDKVSDLVAEHLDHMHYINDILNLDIASLNEVLIDQLLRKLFLPLCLGSLVPNLHEEGPHVSAVVALFLLSQVFLIINHRSLVNRLAKLLLFGDNSMFAASQSPVKVLQRHPLSNSWSRLLPNSCTMPESSFATCLGRYLTAYALLKANKDGDMNVSTSTHLDESGLSRLDRSYNVPSNGLTRISSLDELSNRRPLYASLLKYLDTCCSDYATDQTTFYAIAVVYAMMHNPGVEQEVLELAGFHSLNDSGPGLYNVEVVECLLNVINKGTDQEHCIRVVTLELAGQLLKDLVHKCKNFEDRHLAQLLEAKEKSVLLLRGYFQGEELFLDIFEDEFVQFQKHSNRVVRNITTEPVFLLPPIQNSISGIEITKRLPSGPQEYARKAIRVFFILHYTVLELGQEKEPRLPLSKDEDCVGVDDCLNLNKSDLLSCSVVNKESKLKRFLVTDGLQMILVEPDTKKMGWGVVRHVAFLQDVEVSGVKEDSRALQVSIKQKRDRIFKDEPSAKFVFDDHIRCMAAKQRLSKGRQKARQYKMNLIAELLEIDVKVGHTTPPVSIRPLVERNERKPIPGYAAPAHAAHAPLKNTDTLAPASEKVKTTFSKQNKKLSGNLAKISQPFRRKKVRVLSIGSLEAQKNQEVELNKTQQHHPNQKGSSKKGRISLIFNSSPSTSSGVGTTTFELTDTSSLTEEGCGSPQTARANFMSESARECYEVSEFDPAPPKRSSSLSPTLLRRQFASDSSVENSPAPRKAGGGLLRAQGGRSCSPRPQLSLDSATTPDTEEIGEDPSIDEVGYEVKEDALTVDMNSGLAALQCLSGPRIGQHKFKRPTVQNL